MRNGKTIGFWTSHSWEMEKLLVSGLRSTKKSKNNLFLDFALMRNRKTVGFWTFQLRNIQKQFVAGQHKQM